MILFERKHYIVTAQRLFYIDAIAIHTATLSKLVGVHGNLVFKGGLYRRQHLNMGL
jgi:glycerol-3-phosphate responsive antiterminator